MTSEKTPIATLRGQTVSDRHSNGMSSRLADFLTLSPDMFWECDADGIVRYVSPDFYAHFSHAADMINRKLDCLFPQDSCQTEWRNWLEVMHKTREPGQIVPSCLLVIDCGCDATCPPAHDALEPLYVQIAAMVTGDMAGAFHGWRGIIRDISREASQRHQRGTGRTTIERHDRIHSVWCRRVRPG